MIWYWDTVKAAMARAWEQGLAQRSEARDPRSSNSLVFLAEEKWLQVGWFCRWVSAGPAAQQGGWETGNQPSNQGSQGSSLCFLLRKQSIAFTPMGKKKLVRCSVLEWTNSVANPTWAELTLLGDSPEHANEKHFHLVFISSHKQGLGCHPQSNTKIQLII